MYALVTQTTSFTLAWSSSMMVGVATVTMVRSTRIMKKPRQSVNSAGHGRASSGLPPAAGALPVSTPSLGVGCVVCAMTAVNTVALTLLPAFRRDLQGCFDAAMSDSNLGRD